MMPLNTHSFLAENLDLKCQNTTAKKYNVTKIADRYAPLQLEAFIQIHAYAIPIPQHNLSARLFSQAMRPTKNG